MKSNNRSNVGTTIMIGSIAAIERHFGFLWGHGKHHSDLSQSEKEWRENWEELRAEIMDFGNDKIKQQYTYTFHFNKNKERGNERD